MFALIKYNYKLFIKTNKFFVPLIVYIGFIAIFYNGGANTLEMDAVFSSSILFLLSLWVGYLFFDGGSNITEQVLYLKVNNFYKYFSSKILFLSVINILLSVVSLVMPILFDVLKYNCILIKETSLYKFLLVFIVLIISSYLGSIIGMIFTTRITHNRSKSILLLSFIALFTLLKNPIINDFSFLKYVLWIVPPIYNLFTTFMNGGTININSLIIPIIINVIYCIIITIIFFICMKKILFRN